MSRRIQVNPGDRYGQLTVVEEAEPYVSRCGSTRRRLLCRCDCGKLTISWLIHLRRGLSKTCGCGNGTHKLSRTATYKAWAGIKQRCYNPNEPSYSDYGGRGIGMCDRWRYSFESFLEDMGIRPTPKHSIDRIDNNQWYFKENCRWATRQEQNNNTRRNVFLAFAGRNMTLADWARELGMSPDTLHARVWRLGWSIEDSLSVPVNERKTHDKKEKTT